jgi:zinc transporter, ZIP family
MTRPAAASVLGSARGVSRSGLTVAILAFGASALLFLVTEELLTEAHETEDTPLVTRMFFLGFFIPLLLRGLQG